MYDMTHDHDTIGFRRGCVACAQVEADLMISKRAYWAGLPSVDRNTAHPEREAPPLERRAETKRRGSVVRLPRPVPTRPR